MFQNRSFIHLEEPTENFTISFLPFTAYNTLYKA